MAKKIVRGKSKTAAPKTSRKPKIKKAKAAAAKAVETEVVEPEIIDPSLDPEITPQPEASTAITTSDPLSRYLQEIRRYPLLTREEEKRLAVRYRETGDPKAAEMLVTSNLRFVVKVAAEYTRFGAKLIDLVQEGNVGLMHAVREFNPYKDVRLITYAVWWIRGYIQEYLMRQYSMVRIGTTATQRKLFYQLQRQKEELDRLGPDQAVAQISGRLGVSAEEVESMQQRLSSRDVSLDKPLSDSQNDTLMNLQKSPDEEAVDERLGNLEQLHLLRDQIEVLRPNLNEKEQVVLDERLLADEPLTLQEIGEKYQITREAVRQIEQRLIEKLRMQFNKNI
ncbi:MAG: RNA polymerase factor sigma-32 [Bdellovibrionales bacterium]